MQSEISDPPSTRVPSPVLLVEDDAIIAMTTEMLLNEIGIDDVRIAGTVAEALLLVGETRFALAVLDLNLGKETSLPIAERLFADKVRVIFATGYGDVDLPEAYREAQILAKPYRLDDLERMVLGG